MEEGVLLPLQVPLRLIAPSFVINRGKVLNSLPFDGAKELNLETRT